jgi:hypothetical protein
VIPDALAKRNHFKAFRFPGQGQREPVVSSPRYFLAFNAALPRVFISALARTNLYRAIDSSGATIDFLLSAFRDADCDDAR